MSDKKITFKLPFLGIKDSQYVKLPWGRQLEYKKQIEEWKATARSEWVSQKRKSHSKAIKEAAELYQAVQWYADCYDNENVRDDVFEFYYKTQEMIDGEVASKGDAEHRRAE